MKLYLSLAQKFVRFAKLFLAVSLRLTSVSLERYRKFGFYIIYLYLVQDVVFLIYEVTISSVRKISSYIRK